MEVGMAYVETHRSSNPWYLLRRLTTWIEREESTHEDPSEATEAEGIKSKVVVYISDLLLGKYLSLVGFSVIATEPKPGVPKFVRIELRIPAENFDRGMAAFSSGNSHPSSASLKGVQLHLHLNTETLPETLAPVLSMESPAPPTFQVPQETVWITADHVSQLCPSPGDKEALQQYFNTYYVEESVWETQTKNARAPKIRVRDSNKGNRTTYDVDACSLLFFCRHRLDPCPPNEVKTSRELIHLLEREKFEDAALAAILHEERETPWSERIQNKETELQRDWYRYCVRLQLFLDKVSSLPEDDFALYEKIIEEITE
jgi:hypothetical protein